MKYYIRFVIVWVVMLILFIIVSQLIMNSKVRKADARLAEFQRRFITPTCPNYDEGGCCLNSDGTVACSSIVE